MIILVTITVRLNFHIVTSLIQIHWTGVWTKTRGNSVWNKSDVLFTSS